MNYKKISLMLLAVLFFIPGIAKASEFNFSVETVQPTTQIDKNKTYFDIQVKPKETQELVIHMRNETEKDVVINPKISSATTNINGVVEYSPNNIKKDKSLKYDLSKLIETEKEIKIPKQGSYDLKLKVKAPPEAFDGVVAGGITLKENSKEEKADEEKTSGLAIKNEFSYVVAVVMHSKETAVKPSLKLTQSFPDQVNARNVIMNNLQNDQPVYLNNLKVVSEIRKEGSDKVLYELTKEDSMQVAPNSNFNFPIPLNGEKLAPGKYNVKMTAFGEENQEGDYTSGKTEDGKDKKFLYKWDLTSDFEITKEKASELNEKDVSIKKDYTIWYIIAGFLLIILALLIVILLMRRKNKNEDVENE